MKNNRNRAYLLSSESECHLFKHNTPYDYCYDKNDLFYISIDGRSYFEAPSTAFTFKDGLTVHEKINARSRYAGLHFVNCIPYRYERLLKQKHLRQPYHGQGKVIERLFMGFID